MWRRLFVIIVTLGLAFGVLFVSIFRTASVKYEFNPLNPQENVALLGNGQSRVDYYLPYPGKVLPDNPLWSLKAIRDRFWLFANTNPSREAELNLLFADKRLASAKLLFEKGKTDLGISTATKAEKYLEEAARLEKRNREGGIFTDDFLMSLAKSSLKHYEFIEYFETMASEEGKPSLIRAEDYPKKVYEESKAAILNKGLTPPENPFNW